MKRFIHLFLPVLVIISIYGRWFLPGLNVANDLHVAYREDLTQDFIVPYTWGARAAAGLGEYAVFVLWNWPINFFYGLLGNLGLTFGFIAKFFILLPTLIIGASSIYKIIRGITTSRLARYVSTLFYLINSYFLLLIDGGQINLAMAYAIFPLGFVFYKEAQKKARLFEILKFSVITVVISIFDIRVVYLLTILLALDFIFLFVLGKDLLKVSKNVIKIGFLTALVLLGFHFYWLLPSVFARAPGLPIGYGRVSQVDFLSFANLDHALFLLQPHWYKNVFGKITPLLPEFVFIPILVFLAPALRKKDKTVGFWLFVALVGIFLVKGVNPPLPQIYPWLFAHFPGFSLFRDPTKFFFLVALSYSVLIGITVDELVKRFDKKIKFFKTKIALIPLIVVAYIVFLARPVYLGKMTGTFAKPIYQEEYLNLSQIFRNDNTFGRVLWIPVKPPLGFSSTTHPSLETFRIVGKRPFATAVTGTYELFNFLRKSYIGELLDILAVAYLVYPYPDTRREELKKDNIDYYYWFLGKLASASWAEPSDLNSKVPAIKVENHQDRFFVSGNVWLIVGSDEIYEDIYRLGAKLSNNAMVFLEESPKVVNEAKRLKTSKFILNRKDIIDLVVAHFPENSFIFPAKNLDFSPDKSGWWKRETADSISWRDFLQQKYQIDNTDFDYSGGWAIGEGTKELSIPISGLTEDDVLFARLMLSSKGGKVSFHQGTETIGFIETKIKNPEKKKVEVEGQEENQTLVYDRALVRWFKIGKIKSSQPISVKVEGDINVVNALASIRGNELRQIEEDIENLSGVGRIVYWDKLSDGERRNLLLKTTEEGISYERISPTHYKVKVEGLRNPSVLAFSETYDSLWMVDGKRAILLYGLINGFEIEKDGEYEVIFEAQKYVLPGLMISGVSIVTFVGLLIFLQRRRIS